MSLTRLRRVKQWQVFARTWWLYDANWQDPFDSGMLIARYLTGRHKPIWYPDSDCGDHVVVINGSKIALPNEEWRWRAYYHDTQWKGGQTWATAWERHQEDPTFVMERAIYRYCGQDMSRYRAFGRLTLLKGDKIPDEIKCKITNQIRQQRPVPQKLSDISSEELEGFPKLNNLKLDNKPI